jgi:hypothetical protein
MEKYGRAGQATDDNMANAPSVLGTKGYTQTRTHARARARTRAHEICNTHCFSTARMVA